MLYLYEIFTAQTYHSRAYTEYAFKQLVDLDLSPKLMREAKKLWAFILQETNTLRT